jgi:hypothetical protein
MSFDDGMDWLDEATDQDAGDFAREIALETVGDKAQLALYNIVRRAYDEEAREGLTRQDLADRLGISRARVSVLLVKPTNMTIQTAARLMFAMGRELKMSERPRSHAGANLESGGAVYEIRGASVVSGVGGIVVGASNVHFGWATVHEVDDLRMLRFQCPNQNVAGIYEQMQSSAPNPARPRTPAPAAASTSPALWPTARRDVDEHA